MVLHMVKVSGLSLFGSIFMNRAPKIVSLALPHLCVRPQWHSQLQCLTPVHLKRK